MRSISSDEANDMLPTTHRYASPQGEQPGRKLKPLVIGPGKDAGKAAGIAGVRLQCNHA